MTRATYTVRYISRQGVAGVASVRVDTTTDHTGATMFYATKLGLWGCGKNSSTPEGAIRQLVQDMATIVSITKD
jgi:PII-like signaling protein